MATIQNHNYISLARNRQLSDVNIHSQYNFFFSVILSDFIFNRVYFRPVVYHSIIAHHMNVGTPFYVIAKHMGWLAISYLVAYVYINQLHSAYGTAAA